MLNHNPTASCTRGERYGADVPDTLDLADRMGLAVNALTNVWFPEHQWALGFVVDFSRRPALLHPNHTIIDAYLNIPPKFLEALVVCRLASGNASALDVDANVLRAQLSFLGDDGLTYCPTNGLPDLTMFDGTVEPRGFSEIWCEGRMLLALSMLAQVDDAPLWRAVARRKVDRLLALTREKEGFRFFWQNRFWPGATPPAAADEPTRGLPIYPIGAVGHGAGLFYRVTGYEPALALSRGLAQWALARVFTNPDGRWRPSHFHHSLYALMAVSEYAQAVGDGAMWERVDACYRWVRNMGDPLTGFYTEAMPGTDWYLSRRGNTVETCEVADMVFLALYLTRAGVGDYWDDVDRWVRNVYAEAQMCSADFLAHVPPEYINTTPSPRQYQDARDIPQRSVGSFWGWMRANDGIRADLVNGQPRWGPNPPAGGDQDIAIMHCCTANGARTLYYVWDSIVTKDAGRVKVNLLLNRASPWLDVDSHLPAEGKVVLHIKDAPTVAVRLPEWCDAPAVQVTVNGEARRTWRDGSYVQVGWLAPGDEVAFTFPVPERTAFRVIGEMPYKLTLRGANVVAIDPKGTICPLYENQPTGQRVQKTRFLPHIRQIIW